jgi:hypothetical protein
MDPKVAEKLVNDVLALKVRTPQTVVECVGVEFAEQFEHLTVMLCEKNLDIDFLKKMFSAVSRITCKADIEKETEEIGLDAYESTFRQFVMNVTRKHARE